MGNQKPEDQEAYLAELKARNERESVAGRKAVKALASRTPSPGPTTGDHVEEPASDYPVITEGNAGETLPSSRPAVGGAQSEPVPGTALKAGDAVTTAAAQRTGLPVPGYTIHRTLPWKDGSALAELVLQRMQPEQQNILLERLLAARDTRGR
uniref:hypothetical protein n=1 Tax=Streptomyces sp. CA-141956 TaxID=3240051 RepID=UPI003F49A536